MNPTRQLHELGQSLWLDNIKRQWLDDGTLGRYIEQYAITGLTSNPTIFDKAIADGDAYDAAIAELAQSGNSGEAVFIELALQDLRRAADLFRPVFDASDRHDGWVSMELSPLLASDTEASIAAAQQVHRKAGRDNLMVKIPGTAQGIPAIEQSIFDGVPINVTLLFSREHYLAAAKAYMRGVKRRIEANRDPRVGSVASLFVSRWDVAANEQVPVELHNQLGIAICGRTYRAYRELLASREWRELADAGARPQRLLWASTGTKDPDASPTLYVEALAAPDTINTMPEKTLEAFAEHGTLRAAMPIDGGDAEATLTRFAAAGLDIDGLAARLQQEGTRSFARSWRQLLERIGDKSSRLASSTLKTSTSTQHRHG
ncbi:MAG TPA: transaldolase [Lysobacter sp.]|nr:transaldolase [Lysobacter sp.]